MAPSRSTIAPSTTVRIASRDTRLVRVVSGTKKIERLGIDPAGLQQIARRDPVGERALCQKQTK
jgi:hypothetical protein